MLNSRVGGFGCQSVDHLSAGPTCRATATTWMSTDGGRTACGRVDMSAGWEAVAKGCSASAASFGGGATGPAPFTFSWADRPPSHLAPQCHGGGWGSYPASRTASLPASRAASQPASHPPSRPPSRPPSQPKERAREASLQPTLRPNLRASLSVQHAARALVQRCSNASRRALRLPYGKCRVVDGSAGGILAKWKHSSGSRLCA